MMFYGIPLVTSIQILKQMITQMLLQIKSKLKNDFEVIVPWIYYKKSLFYLWQVKINLEK